MGFLKYQTKWLFLRGLPLWLIASAGVSFAYQLQLFGIVLVVGGIYAQHMLIISSQRDAIKAFTKSITTSQREAQ